VKKETTAQKPFVSTSVMIEVRDRKTNDSHLSEVVVLNGKSDELFYLHGWGFVSLTRGPVQSAVHLALVELTYRTQPDIHKALGMSEAAFQQLHDKLSQMAEAASKWWYVDSVILEKVFFQTKEEQDTWYASEPRSFLDPIFNAGEPVAS